MNIYIGALWQNRQDFELYCPQYLIEGLFSKDILLRCKSSISNYQKQLAKKWITECY